MAIETTLILCKPDAVQRGLVGEIISRIERRGYIITAMKLIQLPGDKAREHYAELAAEERDWKDADLVAAREACHHKIDFAAMLPKVDRLLS